MNNLSKVYGKRVRVNSPGSRWNGQYGNIVKVFYGIQFDDEKDLSLYRNIIEEHVEEAYELTEPEKVEKEDTSDLGFKINTDGLENTSNWVAYTLNDKMYYNHGCSSQLFEYPWFYCPLCGKRIIGVEDYD